MCINFLFVLFFFYFILIISNFMFIFVTIKYIIRLKTYLKSSNE